MAYVLNGKFHSDDNLVISWRDPFFATGLGVFETLRTINSAPMFLARHYDRLMGGAATLQLKSELTLTELRDQVDRLMKAMPTGDARIKICLLLAEGGVDVLVTGEEAPPFTPRTEARSIVVQDSPFADGCDLPRTKLWNRMPYALARRTAEEEGFDDALFVSPQGLLTETTRANLFFVKDGRLCTPKLGDGILPGVTRAVIINLAKKSSLTLEEGDFPLQSLLEAEEVFLTGSFSGIQPVYRIEEQRFDPAPGPKTLEVIRLYEREARESIC